MGLTAYWKRPGVNRIRRTGWMRGCQFRTPIKCQFRTPILRGRLRHRVIILCRRRRLRFHWIPAFAGMTNRGRGYLRGRISNPSPFPVHYHGRLVRSIRVWLGSSWPVSRRSPSRLRLKLWPRLKRQPRRMVRPLPASSMLLYGVCIP